MNNASLITYYQQLWDQIHSRAANATTTEQKNIYCSWIREITTKLYCPTCRTHAIEYIKNKPPENDPNLFHWTWEFHNNVNARLNKPIMEYTAASNKYLGWG